MPILENIERGGTTEEVIASIVNQEVYVSFGFENRMSIPLIITIKLTYLGAGSRIKCEVRNYFSLEEFRKFG